MAQQESGRGMRAAGGFFARRWRGEAALPGVLWRDMLLAGSAVNLIASFAALMLAAQGADLRWAVALHFAPLPYNLLLFRAVWCSPQRNALAVALAALWFAVMTIV